MKIRFKKEVKAVTPGTRIECTQFKEGQEVETSADVGAYWIGCGVAEEVKAAAVRAPAPTPATPTDTAENTSRRRSL